MPSAYSDMRSANESFEDIPMPEPEKTPALAPLTIRKPSEILAMEFSQEDCLLENGYLAKGDPIAICGAPGVGKSRLYMQLTIALVTGRNFLGWKTNGRGSRWLLLQTENSNRRLQSELFAMYSDLSEKEKQAVEAGIFIHTLETAEDSFVSLKLVENEGRISAAIQEIQPTGVIYDVLRDYGIGDLNTDEGMTATLSVIGRLTRQGDPQRIPMISHHALTGKSGAARATGTERGSFGRNSKVLLGWVRSQINIAAYNPDDNEVLIVASGKSNNAEEFQPFAVQLDVDTMTYHRDNSVDIEEWKERVGADTKATAPRATISTVVEVVEAAGLAGIEKSKIVAAVKKETGVSATYAYRLIDQATDVKKAIVRRKEDKLYVVPRKQ
jgi:hypothetical protein